MSSQDYVQMDLPNGDSFVGTGNLTVVEEQTPAWLIGGGFGEIIAATNQVFGGDNYSEQVFLGAGSKVRQWRVDFTNWEGNTDTWSGAQSDDDVIVKLQALANSLATQGITSTNVATLSFGEYSSSGTYSPQSVVPGAISLPLELGEEPSTFRASIEWVDAVDLDQVLHSAP